MSTDKKKAEFELNKESSSELGPDELSEVAGGLRGGGGIRPVEGGGGTSAACCIGCNTMDTVTSGCGQG